MMNEQTASGATAPPIPGQQPVMPRMQGVPQVTYSAAQTQQSHQHQHQQQHMLNALAQAPMDAAQQLLMNPHTAGVIATVAAAAAQQMAQHQQNVANQQQHHQHQQQAMQTSPAPPQNAQQQQHMAHSIVAPPSASSPPNAASMAVQQVGLPPHLAALLGIPHQVAAAPTNVYATHSAPVASVVPSVGAPSAAMLNNMQNWKQNQLESHVQILRDTNQTIPQPVAMLLADARRKEEKRTAKRVANRKSACTSRARKKALVEEMTRTNARLKRQALILALLPDLVIAITIEGEITFCSAQVERVLRHKMDDLIGANLMDLLIPASGKAMKVLVDELVAAEQAAAGPALPAAAAKDGENANASGQSSSTSSNGVAIVSDQSFPPSVVKVESQQSSGAEESSLSTSNNGKPAAASNSKSATQSVNSSLGNDDATAKADGTKDKQPSSDDNSLSSSSDANNLRQANENLNRNVRWHNENLMSKSQAAKAESTHKDDVTGQAVTPNNAGARLSSLQHRPEMLMQMKRTAEKMESMEEENSSSSSDSLLAGVEEKKKTPAGKNGNSSDESGYRESNESAREGEDDTESSTSDSSSGQQAARRQKPLAPTCNICLIRDDLTTIWCEVTSSIRTRSLKDEAEDANPPALALPQAKGSKSSKTGSSDDASDEKQESKQQQPDEIKELLLCLRPIRDGEQKVDESMRFTPVKQQGSSSMATEDETMISGDNEPVVEQHEPAARRPVKKRPVQQPDAASSTAKVVSTSNSATTEQQPDKKKARKNKEDDPEKSVVESLMLMGGKC
mmetsp:Transcript_28092/g.46512  ORF Transcript_28092/g.46512 Transcript_28092/m.46512 type:complete len:794 (+) Transcript_28092:229-2610(+)